MKELGSLFVIFAGAVILVSFSGCYSVASIGDSNNHEKRQMLNSIREQIDFYREQIEASEIFLPLNMPAAERDSIMSRNRRLAESYQDKISRLEAEIDNFLISSSKEEVRRFDLSGSAEQVADAYLIIKYADNIPGGRSIDSSLSGLIENRWHREVIAQVHGPGGFFREFVLKARSQSPVFRLPVIGNYTVNFLFGRELRSITKEVGPGVVYYDADGQAYSLKATLPAY